MLSIAVVIRQVSPIIRWHWVQLHRPGHFDENQGWPSPRDRLVCAPSKGAGRLRGKRFGQA